MPENKKYLIIVAGGMGKRMQSQLPKQFLLLKNKPVLMHVFQVFYRWNKNLEFLLVLPEDQFETWQAICKKYCFDIPHLLVAGGKERFQSVKNALEKLPDTNALIGIHDGVRPLVHEEVIKKAFNEADKFGNAIPAIEVKESVRVVKKNESRVFDRSKLRLIQTPQVFHLNLIKKAYRQEYRIEFTDDASVLEASGEAIHLVEGNPQNIKITDPHDLELAEFILSDRK